MRTNSLYRRALAVFLALMIAAPELLLAAVAAPQLPNPGSVMGISPEQEIQAGRQGAAQISKQLPVLPDSNPVSRYVQQLGSRLVSVMPQPTWPYNFHVVQQSDINAFALPGGPIFVNLGTITAADNEAELVGVIAHEMSHVYMRHSAKMATKQSMAQGVVGVLGSLLGGGVGGSLARLGMSLGVGSYLLKYSRDDEAQADSVGAIIMYKAGYNPVEMAEFFHKLQQEGGSRGPQFLSDHPNPGNRVAAVSNEIKNWPPKSFQQSSPQFAQAKQEAQRTKAYTAQQISQMAKTGQLPRSGDVSTSQSGPSRGIPGQQQGGTISNISLPQVEPSGNFKTLQHNAFTLAYPDNWQVYGDPNSGVTIAPQGGIAQNNVAYGVIVNGFQPQNAASLDDATHQLIASLEQSNPDLRVLGKARVINVNGRRGRSVDMVGTSPVQQNGRPEQERDWLVTVPRPDGSMLYVVFVSPDNDFNHLRPTFQQMLRSFRVK
ncbi:MAG: M48 family metalloprotease [Terriglobales bacterium]